MGDKKEFEKVYTEYYTRLYYFALHIVGDEEAAKDLLNDVFTGLWKGFHKLDKKISTPIDLPPYAIEPLTISGTIC